MKTFIVVASLIALNFLGGCVVPQSPYGYGGIQSPAGIYEGILTPSLDYQEGAFGYDSYGQPYTIVGGQPSVIVFEANRGWGYYDIHRHWREAPRHMIGTLERDHPRGHGLPPPSPAHLMGQHPQGMPPMGQHPQGMPPMGQHPQGMLPMGQHPQGVPPKVNPTKKK